MKLFLFHTYYSTSKLNHVIEQMEEIGAPEIAAVWRDDLCAWCALEGSHRIRAAYRLGLTPKIIPIELSEEKLSDMGFDCTTDLTVKEAVETAHNEKYFIF